MNIGRKDYAITVTVSEGIKPPEAIRALAEVIGNWEKDERRIADDEVENKFVAILRKTSKAFVRTRYLAGGLSYLVTDDMAEIGRGVKKMLRPVDGKYEEVAPDGGFKYRCGGCGCEFSVNALLDSVSCPSCGGRVE